MSQETKLSYVPVYGRVFHFLVIGLGAGVQLAQPTALPGLWYPMSTERPVELLSFCNLQGQ